MIDDQQMERVMTAKYFGDVTNVDDNIGRILAELERLGMMDNTIILFSADHGNMLGERAKWFKGVQYDGSAQHAAAVARPKGAPENTGRVETKIIENTDFTPTLLEAVGLPIPQGVQGRSFLKLARGKDPDVEGSLLLATALRHAAHAAVETDRQQPGSSGRLRAVRHAQRSEGGAQSGGRSEA